MAQNSSRLPDDPQLTAGLFRTFAATLFALVVGVAVILQATDGGRALTTESLRRSKVERNPQLVPNFLLRESSGRETGLRQLLSDGSKVWIVDFVYTRCQTVCSALGATYQQLQRRLIEHGLEGKVALLSISFDPANDDMKALRAYASRMQMQPAVWQIATLASPADRRGLLDAFGIMVIPAPLGEFEHNAAFHIIDGHGRLVRIVGYSDIGNVLDSAMAWYP